MLTVVVIFYLGLSLLVGVFLSRRVKKTSDFLIAPFLLSISVSYDAFMRYQSARVAQWGCILSGMIVIFISFCTALIGSAGR
jgi:hypothetical protein